MKTRWKLVVIALVLGYSMWALLPSIRYYSKTEDERNKLTAEQRDKFNDTAIKLGLDLQGGAHLVMEIDDSNLPEDQKVDAVDRAIKILRNRIDQFGVSEPNIQKQGEKRIIIELPASRTSTAPKASSAGPRSWSSASCASRTKWAACSPCSTRT